MPANAMDAFPGWTGELSTSVADSDEEGVIMRLWRLLLALPALGVAGPAFAEAGEPPLVLRGSSAPPPAAPPQVIVQTVVYPEIVYVPAYYPAYSFYPAYYIQPWQFRRSPFAAMGSMHGHK
jgi:hypothetical protein